MKKHGLRGLLLGASMALLLAGGVALADPEPPANISNISGDHDVGEIVLTVDDDGGWGGKWFLQWPVGTQHLSFAVLAVGNASDRMMNGRPGDWVAIVPEGVLAFTEPGVISDEDSYAQYNDDDSFDPEGPLGLRVAQYGCAWGDPPNDDFVLVAYVIENTTDGALNDLYAGHCAEFDVDGDWPDDCTSYDAQRSMAYQWECPTSQPEGTYVGVSYLTDNVTSYNRETWETTNCNDAKTYTYFSNGNIAPGNSGVEDWTFYLGTGALDLQPGEVTVLGTAWAAGEDLADLQANADQAMSMWLESGGCGTCAVVEGTVSYAGSAAGVVQIGALQDPEQAQADFGTEIDGPGEYDLAICEPGTYHICAFMDLAGNGPPPDEGVDPQGCYPLVVDAEWTETYSGIDIVLEDPVVQEEFVPEPGTMLLFGSGLAGLAGYGVLRWRARD